LGTAPDPFDESVNAATIAERVLGSIPARLEPGSYFPVAQRVTDVLAELEARTLGRLALLAEEAEVDIAGLPGLPDPPATDEG